MASQLFSNFDAEMNVALAWLNSGGNALRLKVSTTKMTYLNGQKALWDPLYLAWKDPLTKAESQKDLEDLYKTFNQDMEDNKESLKSNTDITLTGTDILKLYIHVDAERRHYVAVPNFAPVNSCTHFAIGHNKIYAGNPTEGHITDKHLPDDVAKIGRAIAFVPHYQPAPTRDKYSTISSVGSTSFDLIIASENRHMVAYIITWYINNRGDFGGESDPFPFDTV